ncbi:hypothetical protein LTS08_005881 [Lithohypha guttulata]|uniref:uncharacterized protein n=1 Tax=Lithohypha guttulata TaxID=1690604 RepID=UPI002DDF98C3|nr:hypothetical protein LTR51_002394 [Lithohypha guttulata]KAK5099300.1 hypothetical protein LTS08_005881 [Lithohypha guttulata]
MATIFARQDTSTDDGWSNFKLWHYTPSLAAAAIFTVLFIILMVYHSILLVRRRTWFCVPFVVGGLLEVIGYIARALAHSDTISVGIYSIQSLCLLLAPILFAASIYMILGRIIRVVYGENYSFVRVNWLTKIFVGGDVLCFMIQGAGGGLLATATTASQINIYNNIILGGLILQILIFLVFIAAALVFQFRMQKRPTSAALEGPLGEHNTGKGNVFNRLTWKKLMLGLYVTSILITIRNLFRVIEYGMGWDNYLLAQEWPIYVLDAFLMVLVLIVCVMWYNPKITKNPSSRHEMQYMNSERLTSQAEAHGQINPSSGPRPWS